MDKAEDQKKKSAEKPVSLRPLKFEEAVRDLLKVRPKERNKNTGPNGEGNDDG